METGIITLTKNFTSHDIIAGNGREGFKIGTKFNVINGLLLYVLFNTNILFLSHGIHFQFEDFFIYSVYVYKSNN